MIRQERPAERQRWLTTIVTVVAILLAPALHAANRLWDGSASADFETAANWDTPPANNLTADVGLFSGTVTANQPQLSVTRSIKGLSFTSTAGGWVLDGGAVSNVLSLGTSGLATAGQSSGLTTVRANLSVGAAQSWVSGTGSTLLVTGSVTGSGGFPLSINSAGNSGMIVLSPASGRSVSLSGSSNNLLVAARLGGVLALGGDGVDAPTTDSVNQILSSGAYGALTVTGGGLVRVNSGTWNLGDLGRNSSTDHFSGTLEVRGGSLSLTGARYLGAGTITVSGGSLAVTSVGSVYTNGGRFSPGAFGTSGTANLSITGGMVDLAKANLGNTFGSAIATRVNHSGGVLTNGVTVGGGTNGGTVDTLTIGATGTVSNNSSVYTLSGTARLVSAGAVLGATSSGTGNLRNFNFTGGILSVGAYDATNLGYASSTGVAGGVPNADPVANSVGLGTLYNHGGTLAPGTDGIAGCTTITGNYVANSANAALAIDLGGTTRASAFQNGQHDAVTVTGNTTLTGSLVVNVLSGFTPAAADSFRILSSTGTLTGAFSNVPFGGRVVSRNGLFTFVVSRAADSVYLGECLPVTTPVVTGTSAPSQITAGDSVVLSLTAESLAPLTYVWRKDGVLVSGATSSTLTLIGVQPSDSGSYEVTASNAVGSVTRSFQVVITTPATTVQAVVDAGAARTFAAAPGASAYQWILDGETVGTSPTYTYSPTTKGVGTHWLRVVETYPDNSSITRPWSVRVRIPVPVSALNYYVSSNGSDSSPGTLGAPFATLEKARDTIRALARPLPAGGVTVFLRGGIYRRTATFALTSSDSGSASAPVVYAAFPGETPVLTGARPILASQIVPLNASEQDRVAPGVDAARIWEIDVTGSARAAAFPNVFNEWWIYNALRSSQNGGLLELFRNGERMPLSRYPNADLSDDTLTTSLTMNGVATGAASDGTGYLNGAGTYTDSNGVDSAVGGAFQFKSADAAHVARWKTALTRGGVWLAGYWRVPWQLNGAKVGLIDTGSKQVIAFASGAAVPNGIGNKYTRPAGNQKEPYWAINLLEEIDQAGEWCVDFNRKKIYILLDSSAAPADGEIELSDLSTPLVQINGGSDLYLQGITFRRQLGHAVQILGGARNLVLGCSFSQNGNFAVDINGGTSHGVVSCNLEKLGSGGIILRGGAETPSPVNSDQFVVNNRIRSFSEVVRVYQAAIDSGYGGPLGSSKQVSVGTRIAHNDARTAPHGGILWGSYNQVIEYNDVSDYCRISEDFGGIYRFGPNYQSASVIRYNHVHHSRLGDGIYNDMDHVKVAMYGNVTNLRTPSTATRGYGFWTNTNTATGGAVPGLTMALNLYNNISVNSRSNYSLHSSTGGVIRNNLSYRKLAADFNWYRVTTDTGTNTNSYATSNAATLQSGPNPAYTNDPGFIDFANDDLRLRPDARAYQDLPDFVPIPLEMTGLYNDEYRSDATVRTPFVVTGNASSIGANSATFNGNLIYPQFDASATVSVYWGTTDGGTNPAAWQRVAVLGQPGSGHVGHIRADLSPATRYYFRFHAVNPAGHHWAEQGNSFTTFPLVPAPTDGVATADSAGTPPSNAFDGNPATDWQTAAAVTTGTLTYQFADGPPVVITRYSITSSAESPARDPRDWQFFGSNDGLNWFVLDTRTGQTFSARNQTLTFGFSSTSAFRFHRLVVTANNGDPTALQLAELTLAGPSTVSDSTGPVIVTPGNLTATATSPAGANVSFDVSAVDAASGNASVVTNPVSGALFPPGSTTVTATATDASGNTSTASFTVTVIQPTALQSWRQSYFGTIESAGDAADDFDADGDGLVNLLEYALGGSPVSGADAPVPVMVVDGGIRHFSFNRARSDVTYTVEGSSDLTGWTTVASNPGTVGGLVTVDDTSSGVRRFLRLRVTGP